MRKVDLLGGVAEQGEFAADVLVALLEGLQGGDGAAFEVELGLEGGPVDF